MTVNPMDAANAAIIRERIGELERQVKTWEQAGVTWAQEKAPLEQALAERTSELKRVLAREHLVGDALDEVCPGWEGEYEDAIRKLGQERDALAAALSTYGRCRLCGGHGAYEALVGEDERGNIQSEGVQCECRAIDPTVILSARLAAERKAGAEESFARFKWRPISEAHEDYGTMVLCNANDPGDVCLGHVCQLDWDEVSEGMTHFARVPAFWDAPVQIEKGEVEV